VSSMSRSRCSDNGNQARPPSPQRRGNRCPLKYTARTRGGSSRRVYVARICLLHGIAGMDFMAYFGMDHDSVEMVDIRCCLYAIYILLSFVVGGYLVARESLFHHS